MIVLLFLCAFTSLQAKTLANTWNETHPSFVLPEGRHGSIIGTSWNTWTYRAKDNSLLYYDRYVGEEFPNTIYGNTLTAWSLDSNRVTALVMHDTVPSERHTYEAFVYVDSLDAVYMMLGATHGCGSDGKMWEYSFATGSWRVVSTTVPDAYGCEVHMQYWKKGHQILFLSGDNKVFSFDFSSHQWSPWSITFPPEVDVYNAKSTWDTKRDLWVFYGGNTGNNLAAFDPSTKRFTLLTAPGLRPKAYSHTGITYLPGYDAFMIAGGITGTETWVYENATHMWHVVSGANVPDDGFTSLFYSSKNDQVYLMNGCQGCTRRFTLQYQSSAAILKPRRLPRLSWNPFQLFNIQGRFYQF